MALGWTCRCWARKLLPRKKTPRMVAIQVSVVAALREPGALKAPTPLEMASVPVMATHPPEKARSIRNVNAKPVGDAAGRRRHLRGVRGDSRRRAYRPSRAAQMPVPMSASIATMKAYVGTLNAAPDSRTPRRFTNIRTTIAPAQRGTVLVARDG